MSFGIGNMLSTLIGYADLVDLNMLLRGPS